MNEQFLALKQQVEAKNSTPAISKSQRKALFWQNHLKDQKIDQEFSLLLPEINTDLAQKQVGPHGHTCDIYQLSWVRVQKNFFFQVTNIKAKKSMSLVKCPDFLLDVILPNMEAYLDKLFKFLIENANYDEEYAENAETLEG